MESEYQPGGCGNRESALKLNHAVVRIDNENIELGRHFLGLAQLAYTFRSFVTRPVRTHSTTKMFPSLS